ncbi:DUF3710 domain-containing protein [Pedococcus dokdonensis]|uniref:DUF3710 domain-containing protein n=1 Tax=Pedococcus dokdonensis TaxID=443156 RepID=UPI001E3622A3|nr:DUF3710 domain-containing protein [Pedococcus dokdonensis]
MTDAEVDQTHGGTEADLVDSDAAGPDARGTDAAGADAAGADPADLDGVADAPGTDGVVDAGADEGEGADEGKGLAVDPAAATGPYDASEVEADDGRLDLGALRIMGVPGMELRLEIDEAADQVVGATAVIGDSAVQIQAFAAPKTMGIWDDIRGEIAESILAQGGTADEARGALGTELRTRMPSAGPDGRTVFAPARFAGVDGPRWFLRAVFSGRAAIDDAAAEPLLEVVRGAVVVRGDAAMAPREMLTLTLPAQVETHDHDHDHDHGHDHDHDEAGRRVDDLKPFERGPEITEVR